MGVWMKLIHHIPEGHIMSPGLNFLETECEMTGLFVIVGWVLYVPLWAKHQTRYNIAWMEDQTGDWRLNFFLRRYRKVWRWEFFWTAPERDDAIDNRRV